MNELLVYVPRITSRVEYVFGFIFSDILGVAFRFTSDKQELSDYQGAKLVYNHHPLADELYFGSSQLLFETHVVRRKLQHNNWNGLKGFFRVDMQSVVPFDLFASAFYLLSRYDEVLTTQTDAHGRIRARDTTMMKYKMADSPVVDVYAYTVKRYLRDRYPALVFRQRNFRYHCTVDVDMAFKYVGKSFFRQIGGFFRSLMNLNFNEIDEARQVRNGLLHDPYNTFGYISEVAERYAFPLSYFWLLGEYSGYDKNIPVSNPEFRKKIHQISSRYDSHIHLSYRASKQEGRIPQEIKLLEDIIGKPVRKNRFHYLRFRLPESYQQLLKYKIQEDYSMGYSTQVGFRAGTCTPFYYFDLSKNEVTRLKVVPFAYMDAAMQYHIKYLPDQALRKMMKMVDAVREVDGPLCVVWHNNSLSEEVIWKGWRRVFEESSEYAMRYVVQKQDAGHAETNPSTDR